MKAAVHTGSEYPINVIYNNYINRKLLSLLQNKSKLGNAKMKLNKYKSYPRNEKSSFPTMRYHNKIVTTNGERIHISTLTNQEYISS